jgi:osmotically-inducible protein OsmY
LIIMSQARELRRRLTKILLDDHKLDMVLLNVTVTDGKVRLWGIVGNADEAAAAMRAAESLHGVKSVVSNLSTGPMSGIPM